MRRKKIVPKIVSDNMGSTKPEQLDESIEEWSVEEETNGEVPTKLYGMDFYKVLDSLEKQQNPERLSQMPASVKRRIKALKKMQLEATHIEAKFFAEVHSLECKYHKLYVPMYEKRSKIIKGDHEPTEDEAQWPSDDEEENLGNQLKSMAKIDEESNKPIENGGDKKVEKTADEPDPKGIPNFWLTIFQNVNLLSEMVQPPDEAILSHLLDIKVDCSEDPMVRFFL